MDILVITWNFPPRRGGIENLLAGLCHNLKKTHRVFVITSCGLRAGLEERCIFRSQWPGLVAFFLYGLYKGCLLLWRHSEIKVIFGGSALVTPLVVLLAKTFRRKAVVYIHGSDLIYSHFLYQLLCVRWLRSCDQIIANSHYTATLAEKKKVRCDFISVISPGVNAEVFASSKFEDPKEAVGLEGRKVLLYVGRLARRKGVKEFIEKSLPKIVAEIPRVCFAVVGGNPSESLIHHDDLVGELRVLVRDRGLQNHVGLLGWLSDGDLAKIYHASDLMVLPVLSMPDDVEGFGIVLLEAAAAGKPAVATHVGGIPDAVENGKSGILVSPEDYDLMSRSIVALLQDDQTRVAMGQYAQSRVKEKFDWEEVLKKYDEVFSSLTDTDARSNVPR